MSIKQIHCIAGYYKLQRPNCMKNGEKRIGSYGFCTQILPVWKTKEKTWKRRKNAPPAQWKNRGQGVFVWGMKWDGSHLVFSCQNATALAAATFKESTPWDMGMQTV